MTGTACGNQPRALALNGVLRVGDEIQRDQHGLRKHGLERELHFQSSMPEAWKQSLASLGRIGARLAFPCRMHFMPVRRGASTEAFSADAMEGRSTGLKVMPSAHPRGARTRSA